VLSAQTYRPNSGQAPAVSRVRRVGYLHVVAVSCPSPSGVPAASAPVRPSALLAPAQRPASASGVVGTGWTRGVASAPQGIAGAERTIAAGKARTQQPDDLFDLMNRRASRPWRPPH
jgi:hypothetical protein